MENYSPCCCCYYYYLAVIPLTFFPGGRHKELLSCSQGHPTRKYQLFTSISFNYRAAENQITANLHYFMACLKCRTATFTPKHEQLQESLHKPCWLQGEDGGVPCCPQTGWGRLHPFHLHILCLERGILSSYKTTEMRLGLGSACLPSK